MKEENAIDVMSESESNKAMRFNEGKPQFSLIDFNCLTPMAHVLEFGATKYERDNWKKGHDFSSLIDSLLRHVAGLQKGEWLDPESGLPHIGHLQCNTLFMGLDTNTIDIEKLKENYNKWMSSTLPSVPYTT